MVADGVAGGFVDGGFGGNEFPLGRILGIAEQKMQAFFFAGGEIEIDLMRGDRLPAVRDAFGAFAGDDRARGIEAFVDSDEGIARGVET